MAKQAEKSEKPGDVHAEFFADYGNLSVGKILTKAARGDDALRARILDKERAGQGRASIIQALVNWNS